MKNAGLQSANNIKQMMHKKHLFLFKIFVKLRHFRYNVCYIWDIFDSNQTVVLLCIKLATVVILACFCVLILNYAYPFITLKKE